MVQPEPTSSHLLTFRAAQIHCAIRLDVVAEIIALPLLSRPPSTPPLIEGFLNLAGSAIPVLRLDRLFNLAEQPLELYTPLIVLRNTKLPCALLVDAIDGVITVSESAYAPLNGGHSFNGCAEAIVQAGSRSLHVLSIERLLLEQERLRLQQCQAEEQQRLQRLAEAHA